MATIRRGLDDLRGFEVQTAFLHVARQHPLRVFAQSRPDRIPTRGVAVPLGKREMLICVTGPKEVLVKGQGFPAPLLLKLHRDSTFTDLDHLARQVFSFSAHSWRNYRPTSLPVTILYSELVAKLLGKLANVDGWDPDVLLGAAGKRRWFL